MSPAKDLIPTWSDPPSSYRSAPFWSWNDRLSPERLCRQIEGMHQAGMGGFFMHSRYGLKTSYLSEEWFQCVSACVEKARQLGMKAYLYDEDRWPSGSAGGIVTRGHVEFRAHQLLCSQKPQPEEGAERVGAFRVELDEAGLLRSYSAAEEGSGGEVFYFDAQPAQTSPWFNDGAYLDTMSPEAVAEFIRVTHQAYALRYGKDFGQLIPAIFTDEPNYWHVRHDAARKQTRLPWTHDLPREFKARRGYDLREHLPELLFAAGPGRFSKVRCDYFRTVTELFVENFSGQIGRWCGQRNIASTGHMLSEESLESQIRVVGACMPHYEHMQWPGIDILTDRSTQEIEVLTAKQCSSVADQLGKQRVLSELYGCTGWDWPLEGHKFVGDWHLVLGVNFRCPHLTHYSLAGGAKRDYPASIYAHSPWWKYYKAVEDYFARLNFMLTQGSPVRDVLVIHPIESAWGLFDPAARQEANPLRGVQASLDRIVRTLTAEHYDWDFADESLLARHGKVGRGTLKVGKMSYQLVIVPPSVTLRATTVAMLGKLLAAGGKVLLVGPNPTHVDGEPSDKAAELASTAVCCGDATEEFLPTMERLLPRRVSVTEGGRQATLVWSMLRAVKGGQLLFLQSHDRTSARTVRVSVAGRRPVVQWDAMTGQVRRVKAGESDGRVEFDVDLDPTGSALFSLGLSVQGAGPAAARPDVAASRAIDGPYDIELTEPNTMPLDYCAFRVGEEAFSEPVPTLKAEGLIRKRFGLPFRWNDAHQPWYLYATGVVDTAVRGRCRLRYAFNVAEVPARCKLAIERPENFRVSVNGSPAGEPDGFWVDEDIRTIDITALVRPGANEVLLDFDYRPDMELEDLYLVGEFGVSVGGKRVPGNLTLTAAPRKLNLGSWVGQGLDFYGAAVKYRLKVDRPAEGRLRIALPKVACTAAAIHVNGKTFALPWAPFAADVTDALKPGANDVLVEVIGGRKNILGPLHTPWIRWTGPGEFRPDNPRWTDEYLLVDHGLTGPVVVETLQ